MLFCQILLILMSTPDPGDKPDMPQTLVPTKRPSTTPPSRGVPRHLPERLVPPAPRPRVEVAPPANGPQFRCGSCLANLDPPSSRAHVRCKHCATRLLVPARLRVRCPRCHAKASVSALHAPQEHVCAACGHRALLGEIRLPALRGQPAVHRVHPQSHGSAHADAAWAVMIVGLTLVIAVVASTVR